jgi:hypothetical protein
MNVKDALDFVNKGQVRGVTTTTYTNEQFPVGSIHWQGDVGFLRVAGVVPSKTVHKIQNRAQLAPGSSRGSRHIINASVQYSLMQKSERDLTEGPIVQTENEFRTDHPDHGTLILPTGQYQILYQRQVTADGRVERVRD